MINLIVSDNICIQENYAAFKIQFNSQIFMVAFILMAWIIWVARNEIVFNNNRMGLPGCRNLFFKKVKLIGL